jgi:hypothetical protein
VWINQKKNEEEKNKSNFFLSFALLLLLLLLLYFLTRKYRYELPVVHSYTTPPPLPPVTNINDETEDDG